MEICNNLFDAYLSCITSGYFNRHGVPPDAITEYRQYVEQMKRAAIKFDELDLLKTVFDYYLSHPEISLEDHGGCYTYTDEEVREIIRYARSVIWPENPPIDEEAVRNIKFVPVPLFEWRKQRQNK